MSDEMLELIPEHRIEDVVYFDLYDSHPPAFNFCKIFNRPGRSREDEVEKTTSEVIEIFKRIFREAWSEKNENYLTNGLKTLLEVGKGNINDIQRLFKDKEYRDYIVGQLKDPQLKQFWKTEFAEKKGRLSPGTESTVSSLAYKLDKFLNKKKLLRAVAQDNCIDFKEILDNNKIVIFRFSKDNMSEDMIKFNGGIAIKLLIVAAFARDKSKWNDVYPVFIDECHNFLSENIKTVMYELRKYGVPFVLMHQVLEQFSEVPGLKEAIYGNVGNKITFTVGWG
ncbi:type IV secretion system DNA-binding domain-containing protein [Caldisalinibacter kiritimatiensis]|nr:type IV secretion system DNA-binding domain-containing protein [Caldisalinibacter kiritimatiensis]